MSEARKIKKQSKFDAFAKVLGKFGNKVGKQKHLSAIRDAFAAFLPPLIVGSFAIMIGSVFISETSLLADLCGAEEGNALYESWSNVAFYLMPIFNGISGATMDLFSVYIAFLIGYFLMGSYNGDRLMGGVISLVVFMTLDPLGAGIANGWSKQFIGAQGVVFAMFSGLTAPMVLNKLQNIRQLQIRMPEGVPPVIATSLNLLIPFIITIIGFGLIQPAWGAIMFAAGPGQLADGTINGDMYYIVNAVFYILLQPLTGLSTNPLTVLLILFLYEFIWFFGIHSSAVIGPFINTFWTPLTYENIAMFAADGADVFKPGYEYLTTGHGLWIWTDQTFNTFALAGAGAVLELGIVITLFSKLPSQRQVAAVALPPAAFGISEPSLFGIPITLNPIYFLPFTLALSINGMLAYFFTAIGWLNPTVAVIPWTTPIFLSGFLATFDWFAIVVQLMGFIIMSLFWIPFVLIDVKSQTEAQAKELGITYEEMQEKNITEVKYGKVERKANKPADILDIRLSNVETDIETFNNKLNEYNLDLELIIKDINEGIEFAKENEITYNELSKEAKTNGDTKLVSSYDDKAEKEKINAQKLTEKIEKAKVKYDAKKAKVQSRLDELNNKADHIRDVELPAAWDKADLEIEKAKAKIDSK